MSLALCITSSTDSFWVSRCIGTEDGSIHPNCTCNKQRRRERYRRACTSFSVIHLALIMLEKEHCVSIKLTKALRLSYLAIVTFHKCLQSILYSLDSCIIVFASSVWLRDIYCENGICDTFWLFQTERSPCIQVI